MSELLLSMIALATLLCVCACAAGEDPLAELSPGLSWIKSEGFRMGYNHAAPLDWYPRAAEWGLNGIISRLEIANDPSEDEAVSATLPEGARASWAVDSWRKVQPSSKAAKDNGLHFFYMLGLGAANHNVKDGLRGHERRHNNGELFSPIDDIYWTRVVENRFLRVSEMLTGDEYQLDGFLIDSEMYAVHGAIPMGVDYGDYALSEFCKATGTDLDYQDVTVAERRKLIDERGLAEALYQFEFERVKALAQTTREKLQAQRPDAIMGFFLWKDSLWFKGVAAGFSTPRTPCWVGPESTYPGAFDDEFLAYCASVHKQAGVPILLTPGLRLGFEDEVVPHEFLGVLPGNLYHRSIATAGYWFWALGRLGTTDEEREPFRQALARTHEELDRYHAAVGEYEAALKPAPLPVSRPRILQQLLTDARSWERLPASALPDNAPGAAGISLRSSNAVPLVVRAEEGEELAFDVGNVRLGVYTSPTACVFYGPDGLTFADAQVPLGGTQRVAATADRAGIWVVGITSHNNAFWALPQTSTAAVVAPSGFSLCKPAGPQKLSRCYFYVPKGVDAFTVKLMASEGEYAAFRICKPTGEEVLVEPKLQASKTVTLQTDGLAGRVWWLESTDAIEDHGFSFEGIPNIIAARPDQLLAPEL